MGRLQVALPSLHADLDVSVAMAADMQLLANWLAQFGLPAAPWEPDEAWLDLQLPTLTLSASAMATLSAFAQLRAGALGLGIDLLVPGQATAFARLAATLNARLSAMMSLSAALSFNAGAWTQLSAVLTATAQVQAALALGIFPSPPPGPALGPWRPFLLKLRALLPAIAISTQLGLNLSANLAVELGAMLRVMLRVPMPALPSLSLMCSLTGALSAVAQIRLALGIDPLAIGLPAVRLMVAERVAVTAQAVQSSLGLSLPNLLALLGRLPRLDYCATLMAPPAVVNAAMALNLPPINWAVPALVDLPILSLGLPVVAFNAQLSAALNIGPARVPCPVCDAGAVLSAALGV
jgi:hypothetical protein